MRGPGRDDLHWELTERLALYVAKTAGMRIEQIAK